MNIMSGNMSNNRSPKYENQAQTSSNIENNNNQPNYLSNAKVAQFHKTRMCLNMTNCPRQSRCNYAHSVSELRSNLNLSRTKVCKAYQQGKCRKVSSQCNFAHGLKELVSTFGYFKTKECPDQALGCHKGVYCRNYHTKHERELAEKFIRSQADQSVGSVKHVDFYNYWAREDGEGLDSFLKFNESKLQSSNSYYRRYRNENRNGDYGPSVDSNAPNYPSIPRPAPVPDSENGPELIPGRLNYAKIASGSVEQSSKTKQEGMKYVKNAGYSSNKKPTTDDSRTNPQAQVKNGSIDPKNHTPMRVNPNPSNYGGIPDVTSSPNAHKFGSIDYGPGGGAYPTHHPQYGVFIPGMGSMPGFIPGMGSMQGFTNGASPNRTPQGPPPTAQMLNTNVAALNKLNSLSSFNSFGSFGGAPDSASNSGPFTHFQPLSNYNMMPRDFSSSLHCSSSGNFQWPQSRSQAPTSTTTTADIDDTNTAPNQATVNINSGIFTDNNGDSAALNKEH